MTVDASFDLDRDAEDLDAAAVVNVESLERGSMHVIMEAGESLEIREDGPNKVFVQTATEPDEDE